MNLNDEYVYFHDFALQPVSPPPPPQIITSSIGIADHFTTCARIFDTNVVTGDEDASLYCLVPRVSESTTALFSLFLVGCLTDVGIAEESLL